MVSLIRPKGKSAPPPSPSGCAFRSLARQPVGDFIRTDNCRVVLFRDFHRVPHVVGMPVRHEHEIATDIGLHLGERVAGEEGIDDERVGGCLDQETRVAEVRDLHGGFIMGKMQNSNQKFEPDSEMGVSIQYGVSSANPSNLTVFAEKNWTVGVALLHSDFEFRIFPFECPYVEPAWPNLSHRDLGGIARPRGRRRDRRLPAAIPLSEADIQKDLDRRRPGQSEIVTPRKEEDRCQILSGVFEGKTTGHAHFDHGHGTRMPGRRRIRKWPPRIAPPTRTTPTTRSTASAITVAAAGPRPGKPSAASPLRAVAKKVLERLAPGLEIVAYVKSIRDPFRRDRSRPP